MRFLVNENVTWTVIQELRQRGHNVLSVKESMRSEADDAILARAQTEKRIVVTHDKDFGELAFRARLPASCGVILFRLAGSDPETDNRHILEALESRADSRDTSRSSQTTGFECGLCRVPHRRRRGHDRRAGLPARLPEEHRERGCTSMALEPSSLWRPPARRSALGHHGGEEPGRPDQSAGYLVGMWPVTAVIENSGDDPDYPAPKYQHRVLISETEAIHLDEPVCVDLLIRGEGYDNQIPIGRFLRGPRRLTDKKVRQLSAAAGAEMALMYFKGGGRRAEE